MAKYVHKKSRIGLALGSGAARGWAHIGVLKELANAGIKPDIVCGSSVGALVGGAYCADQLEKFEQWILQLDKREIFRYLDIRMSVGGGFIEGKRLIDFFRKHIGDLDIEKLKHTFACVATNLANGQEVWFRQGSLLEAVRASIALPGFFTPVRYQDHWLVDGGLVNPVPVSLCRAMGADQVIAVNLNGDIVGKHLRNHEINEDESAELSLLEKFSSELKQRANVLIPNLFDDEEEHTVGLFDVVAGSLNIMQDRITRSRMAGDPPDIILSPKLSHIGLLDFDEAKQSIREGHECVKRNQNALNDLLSRT